MSNKEMVIHLLQQLPEETSLEQIAQEIEFVAGIRQGITELDRGEFDTESQLREQLSSWTTSNVRDFPIADSK